MIKVINFTIKIILSLDFDYICYQFVNLELVSKELNHFGSNASFFQDWAPGTLTGGA